MKVNIYSNKLATNNYAPLPKPAPPDHKAEERTENNNTVLDGVSFLMPISSEQQTDQQLIKVKQKEQEQAGKNL